MGSRVPFRASQRELCERKVPAQQLHCPSLKLCACSGASLISEQVNDIKKTIAKGTKTSKAQEKTQKLIMAARVEGYLLGRDCECECKEPDWARENETRCLCTQCRHRKGWQCLNKAASGLVREFGIQLCAHCMAARACRPGSAAENPSTSFFVNESGNATEHPGKASPLRMLFDGNAFNARAQMSETFT